MFINKSCLIIDFESVFQKNCIIRLNIKEKLITDEFGIIKKLNLETKKMTEIMIAGYPQLLAVDWITDNVYVNDNSRPNTIKVHFFKYEINERTP